MVQTFDGNSFFAYEGVAWRASGSKAKGADAYVYDVPAPCELKTDKAFTCGVLEKLRRHARRPRDGFAAQRLRSNRRGGVFRPLGQQRSRSNRLGGVFRPRGQRARTTRD